MSFNSRILLLAMLGMSMLSVASEDKHVEVSMRMIGHQVLLAAGDSTSLVLPIERNGDQYMIRFNTEFGFDPDSIANVIDSVIEATGISDHYVVEFVTCDSSLIAHSYEVGDTAEVLACRGRPQPISCYELFITLMDANGPDQVITGSMVIGEEGNAMISSSWLMFLAILAVVLFAAVVFLISQKSGKNMDPHVIKIGEFLFNKHSMELTFKEDKVELTGKEADLLNLLSSSANETVDRNEILKEVWGDEGDYVGRTLDVFISKLRKKLEADDNVKIINIRGIGYKLVLGD